MDISKYMGLLNTEEGKTLMTALEKQGGDSLRDMAGKAAAGDKEATKRLISQVMSSREGQALAAQVMKLKK
ncbi:hypothetical protein FACS18949_02610 [Clostridia bacterium]|nr:hypothetical protein FACS18949_02610 [Clostridia bacterium]